MKDKEWDITPKEAIELQNRMKKDIRIEPLPEIPETIAGVDVSLERFGKELFAGAVLLKYPSMEVISHVLVRMDVTFPYIPGLLSFREAPGILECLKRLEPTPDLIMVDGQGIAHPRMMGIATHLGLLTGIPTIGCAKSRLYGEFEKPSALGEATKVVDPKTKKVIGYALMSKERSVPIIISPGNRTTPEDALSIARSCIKGYRLPEPTRQAHMLVNKARKKKNFDSRI